MSIVTILIIINIIIYFDFIDSDKWILGSLLIYHILSSDNFCGNRSLYLARADVHGKPNGHTGPDAEQTDAHVVITCPVCVVGVLRPELGCEDAEATLQQNWNTAFVDWE